MFRFAGRAVGPFLAASLLVPSSAPARTPILPPATAAGDLQVFNVSLKLVECVANNNPCPSRWRDYFRQLKNKPFKPDVLSVLEVPYSLRESVMSELATRMNTPRRAFDYVHSDKGTRCATGRANEMNCGNSMVVFRVPKFSLLGSSTLPRRERGDTKATSCSTKLHPNSRDVAARLQEKDAEGQPISGRVVVAAAVHLAPDLGIGCVQEASEDIRDWMADLDGDLKIVAGDFNRTPAGDGAGRPYEDLAQRQERCPAAWYKAWSFTRSTPDPSCSDGFTGSFTDLVRETHDKATEICKQWTAWNQTAEANPDKCTTRYQARKKKRIDFLWAQRIMAGTPAAPTIVNAGTDRGYYDNASNWAGRYSDHRALEALLRF